MLTNEQHTINKLLMKLLTENSMANSTSNTNMLDQNTLNNLNQQQILSNYLSNSQNIQQHQHQSQNLLNFPPPPLTRSISENLSNVSASSSTTNGFTANQSAIYTEQKPKVKPDDFIRLTNTLALAPEAKFRLLDPQFQQFLAIVHELEQTMLSQSHQKNSQINNWSSPAVSTILSPTFEATNATIFGGLSLEANLNRVINLHDQTAGNINS